MARARGLTVFGLANRAALFVGVSALSGLCTTAQGHTIAFSMLMSHVTDWHAHELQDRAVETIANYSAAGAAP